MTPAELAAAAAAVTRPGVYRMDAETYHGDPCRPASLSSTGARKILADCPAQFWWDRNNPPEPSEALDVGSAAHEWLLEGETWPHRHVVLPEDHNARTKAGAAAVEEIRAAGKRPLKHDQFEAIKAMVDALRAHPFAHAAFRNGKAEQSLFWRDGPTGIWCRARPDWTPNRGNIVADYKTCRSARPDDIARSMFDYGYHQQAAWYIDGLAALDVIRDAQFLFVFQQKTAPYLVTCVTPTAEAIGWGRIQNAKAREIFAQCLSTGHWPGYADDILPVDLPPWAAKRLQEKHDAGLYELARAGQAPLEAAE